jgi:hypothetical protein
MFENTNYFPNKRPLTLSRRPPRETVYYFIKPQATIYKIDYRPAVMPTHAASMIQFFRTIWQCKIIVKSHFSVHK